MSGSVDAASVGQIPVRQLADRSLFNCSANHSPPRPAAAASSSTSLGARPNWWQSLVGEETVRSQDHDALVGILDGARLGGGTTLWTSSMM